MSNHADSYLFKVLLIVYTAPYAVWLCSRSVCLLMQSALPCMLYARGPVSLCLKGGTNADMAPQIDFQAMVLYWNVCQSKQYTKLMNLYCRDKFQSM